MSQTLIAALQNPALYPHPVEAFQLIETHISWVLLTGPFAYKIKKPVNFGFLDFSQLEQRGHFCREELRLNQRLTDGLYLEVLPITGSDGQPQLDGQGPLIEYALKMRQFPQSQLLSAVQARGELSVAQLDELALQIAEFHGRTPAAASDHPLCRPEAIMAPMRQNFEQIRPLLDDASDLRQLEALEAWTEASYQRLLPLLETRCLGGAVRECHGDIHLGNAALLDGQVVLFDCIEFNEPFRLIDTALDTAFLIMDLEDRGLQALARRLTSRWLEYSGDYAALPLLDFYKAYRALVRAKVSLFSLAHQQAPEQRAATLRQYRNYAGLAERYGQPNSPFLAITHGPSGSGKSHVAEWLCEAFAAIRIRSDVERKRLFGQQPEQHRGIADEGIYRLSSNQATYQRLQQLARDALQAGYSVVLDAAHLKQQQREAAQQLAEQLAVPFLIIDCQAPREELQRRMQQRQAEGLDPSDATPALLDRQLSELDPLSEAEQRHSLRLDGALADGLARLQTQLQQRLS